MSERVGWHDYFMNIARQAATRSTCDRKHVGAVVVRNKTILSTGYNGSIRGMAHCDDAGHQMVQVEYPGLPGAEVMEMVHKFYDEYYFRPKAAYRILRKAVFNNSERKRLYKEAKAFLKLRAARMKLSKTQTDEAAQKAAAAQA